MGSVRPASRPFTAAAIHHSLRAVADLVRSTTFGTTNTLSIIVALSLQITRTNSSINSSSNSGIRSGIRLPRANYNNNNVIIIIIIIIRFRGLRMREREVERLTSRTNAMVVVAPTYRYYPCAEAAAVTSSSLAATFTYYTQSIQLYYAHT